MDQDDTSRMDIFDHLDELRKRLLYALAALVITTALSFILAQKFMELLTRPVGGLAALQSIEITENIGVFMRVSLLSGFILSMPIIVYQLLLFVSPGLTKKEKTWVYLAVPSASLLFLGGVLFSYFVMLPAAIPFLLDFMGVKTVPRLSNYIDFVTNLMFWIGLSFETPLLIFILAKMKLVNAGQLARQWRIAFVVIAVIAAVATPTPDPVNMGLLMLPLIGLYGLSLLLALLAK